MGKGGGVWIVGGEWVVAGCVSVGAWAGWPHHQHHPLPTFACSAMRVSEETLHGGRVDTGRWVLIAG